MQFIILIISLILDCIFSNLLPYIPGQLSILTPMLTITSILLIYPFYKKKEKNYFITLFILGIIYDLLFTNLLFYNACLFLVLGIVAKYIYKNFDVSNVRISIYTIILITIYELLNATLIIVFNIVPITPYKLFYKIIHSLVLNMIYAEIVYCALKLIPRKYKKISIN